MSTPEQPANPPLTRKKMREIRNTGSTPIIPVADDDETAEPAATVDDVTVAEPVAAPAAETPSEAPRPVVTEVPASVAPLPRAATPVAVPPPPVSDASVDLGVAPLTRRQARQQERIRTASVPVITPDVAEAARQPEPVHAGAGAAADTDGFRAIFGTGATPVAAPTLEPEDFSPVEDDSVSQENEGWRDVVLEATPETATLAASVDAHEAPESAEEDVAADAASDAEDDHSDADEADSDRESERAVVNPALGANLLTADAPETDLPSSFDQILARSTGAVSTSNTLIMSDAPSSADFTGSLVSTGEVILTGTLQLPEGLGSTGHARGTTDGKEADAVLVDGELPAHSSPTPIAASAAISTVKTAGEVIKPPVPEKGSRLMMTLAITAGVLALALVGVLIVAFATGVFS
ncbi:hypothetical protein [Microbacterium sp. C7(2022)]|uniref:hypothetical protein n=1 Tax=Microbacterium sp. C7(2022) TaxID=2992759 RepID=UPI00237C33A8|nr:hypothetical protein [Microbacterium sp. C7(2022)]MDE0546992.1 hypothetical protein [Microbacterium sp. C7(2022)]